MSADILTRGLTADGHRVEKLGTVLYWTDKATRLSHSFDTATGRLEVSGRNAVDTVAASAGIKQSFSRQLVRDQAQRYGWTVNQTGNKFVVTKRTI